MDKPKGGRGHKAPYRTTHLRVPDPIKDDLQSIIDQWRADYLNGEPTAIPTGKTPNDNSKAIALLTDALSLKANAGGKIKQQIREAIAILRGEG
ncbi:MAG: hypothetical protein ACK5PQ_00030 [Alphaproteobacteria bacterium]